MAIILRVNDSALRRVMNSDPRCSALVKARAQEIIETAKVIFLASQKATNEFETSETTPPKYIASFRLEKIRKVRGFAWRASNTDPGGLWVEFGAHAGGKTFVLRYRPMGRALDIVGARYG